MTQRYIRLDAAIARARETDVLGVAERLGARLKKAGGEWVGPCPRCGGLDRFAINARKRIFNCRRCGIGGDAIGMVEHFTGFSFVEAVQFITCEPTASIGEDVENPRDKPTGEAEATRDAFVATRIAAIVRELVPVCAPPGELYLREARAIEPI
jgi:DNA primase